MKSLFKRIEGLKTHIGIIAGGVLGIALQVGWITPDSAKIIGVMIATWTGIAITSKANRAMKG